MARPRIQFDISADEREQLLAMVRTQDHPPSWRLRAKILLMAADGHSNNEISSECSITSAAVTYWKRRFLAGGLHGLVNGSVDGRYDLLPNKEALQIEQVCNAWISAYYTRGKSS
ncbi:helix-turn-helix domain-containing protein [Paraburkholderia sp. CNPSo 3157]|uniref:Helix-turn-helix domain-containing protein n=1 Tax=Paraburkholderia franconis TaxID=2654983 RepID=A0A7X1NIL8_9BURK|nr:helix-turn-helix domain-containing protein [Paraburkholderia franconis]MPW22141.1 helix-turn-helix domain-containing protein [Paraburkholderia franconis]